MLTSPFWFTLVILQIYSLTSSMHQKINYMQLWFHLLKLSLWAFFFQFLNQTPNDGRFASTALKVCFTAQEQSFKASLHSALCRQLSITITKCEQLGWVLKAVTDLQHDYRIHKTNLNSLPHFRPQPPWRHTQSLSIHYRCYNNIFITEFLHYWNYMRFLPGGISAWITDFQSIPKSDESL